MKAILAGDTGLYTETDYKFFTYNCTRNVRCQKKYTIPIPDFSRLEFYILFGSVKPATMEIKAVSTCGDLIQDITAQDYVVGELPNGQWYGVFKNFTEPEEAMSCFVITMAFSFVDDSELRYFSEEYCTDTCDGIFEIRSCYPDNKSALGFDTNNIYYGFHTGDPGDALGDVAVRYYHRLYVRYGEMLNTAHKAEFKYYLNKNFRTEVQKLWEFRCEMVPEFYKDYLMAVIARGVITVKDPRNGSLIKYRMSATNFELVDEDAKIWKPYATAEEISRLYFGCDPGLCLPPCVGNPYNLAMTGPNDGGDYHFVFAGGSVAVGESIEWQILNADESVLVAGSIPYPGPYEFDVLGTTGFNPVGNCYTARWRKLCRADDGGDFSFDFSDDFDTGSGAPSATDWMEKIFGICSEPIPGYYILAERIFEDTVDNFSCDCNPDHLIAYPNQKWSFKFSVYDSGTNMPVAVLPGGVNIPWSYRKKGINNETDPVDIVIPVLFTGATTQITDIVQWHRTICDSFSPECLDHHTVVLDDVFAFLDLTCAMVPIKFNIVQNDWSNATPVGGGWTPAQANIGITDIRGLANFKLEGPYFDNCVSYYTGSETVYEADDQFFGQLAIGTKLFTDPILATGYTGHADVYLQQISNVSNLYAVFHYTLDISTGIITGY